MPAQKRRPVLGTGAALVLGSPAIPTNFVEKEQLGPMPRLIGTLTLRWRREVAPIGKLARAGWVSKARGSSGNPFFDSAGLVEPAAPALGDERAREAVSAIGGASQ